MKYSTRYITQHITWITGGFIVAGLLVASSANAEDAVPLSSKATSFVKEASGINLSEIALAELAEEKSQNAEVKNLAQMIQENHQQSQQKLQTIAQAHGLTLDQSPGSGEHRMQSKLEKLTGSDFDQQYTKDMMEGHVAAIQKFEKASKQIEDADVKQYVQDTLPHLQAHLQHSEVAAKSAGVDQSTITSITKSLPPSMGGTGDKQESEHGVGQP